jgi:hypothetical protein
MARLRRHIEGCPACQRRLADYESLARLLRSQPELDGHALLWQNVRASIAAAPERARRSQRRTSHTRSAQLWVALGSVAAVLALSIGFVAVFASHRGLPATATPVVTPVPTLPLVHSDNLSWHQWNLPADFPDIATADVYTEVHLGAAAQRSGNIAYACQVDTQYVKTPTVWTSTNAGASWSVITPPHVPGNLYTCSIQVDLNDARTLIASFLPTGEDRWTNYVSFDEGQSWSKPASLQEPGDPNTPCVADSTYLMSARGKYFIWCNLVNQQSRLYVSSDRMKTWTLLAVPVANATDEVQVNPSTGEIFEWQSDGRFWSSRDDGAHWTPIRYPIGAVSTMSSASANWYVATPLGSNTVTICTNFEFDATQIVSSKSDRFECTTDEGSTWTAVPLPSTAEAIALGADGSLYAQAYSKTVDPRIIFRLPPGKNSINDWQRLGHLPHDVIHGSAVLTVPPPGGVVVWLYPYSTSVSGTAGPENIVLPFTFYVAIK